MRLFISTICVVISSLTLGQPESVQAMERGEHEQKLARIIDYKFRDASLFDKVFSHSGVTPTNKVPFGQLEFIGDKILGLAVSTRLLANNPTQGEGWLTQTLATLVSNANNARIADQLELLTYTRINPIHNTTGEGLEKIKADTCEALIGAIYTDGGQESAEKFIFKYWNVGGPLPVQAQSIKPILTSVVNGGKKAVAKGGSTPFETYRLAHKLPSHQYECLTDKAPFQVRICFGRKPFTEIFQAPTKSGAKKLAANQALQILQACDFAQLRKGKSGATLLTLLQQQAFKPTGQGSLGTTPTLKAVSKTPIASSKASKVTSAFPTVISQKQSKEKLAQFCETFQHGLPTYTLLSQPNPELKTARVEIDQKGSLEATGNKPQRLAAKEMYLKLTGQSIAAKKAKDALQQVCQTKGLSAPHYSPVKGEFTVRIAVDEFSAEEVSDKSQEVAEKLAAKKLYEALRKGC